MVYSAATGRAYYRCTYCGRLGTRRRGPDGRRWECDHIVPWSWGGATTLENLTLSCSVCNQRKGANLPIDYYTRMR